MNKTYRRRLIKSRLKMRDLTYGDIARAVGVSVFTVSTVINRYPEKKSIRIQRAIALAIGKPFESLWREKGTGVKLNNTIKDTTIHE